MIKKTWLILFLVALPIHHIFSQIDKEFWFATPYVTTGHSPGPSYFRFTSMGKAATVTLSVPANPGISPITVLVPANGTGEINVTAIQSQIVSQKPNVTLDNGIHISSNELVTAYYEFAGSHNPEIYSLKGQNGLGKEFTVVSQNFWENASGFYNPEPKNGFIIVATENNTTVTITPNRNIVGHNAGIPFTIVLQKGEVYYAEAKGVAGNDHLFGSIVTSDKQVAVTTTDDSATNPVYGGCQDLLGDQMVPDDRAGTNFIAIKGFLNNPDKLFIIATQNNTQISVNGVAQTTINRGAIYSIDVTSTNLIYTSKPTHAYHITGTNCEVGAAILPPINCTGSTRVGFTRTFSGEFGLVLIVKSGGENGFTITGNGSTVSIPASNFLAVPGSGGQWMEARIAYNTTDVQPKVGYIVENSITSFHLGSIDGFGGSTGGTYGYYSNFGNNPITSVSTSPVCLGTQVIITASSLPSSTYNWIRPNGIKISNTASNKLTIPTTTLKDTGVYLVQARQNGCLSAWDTVTVRLYDLPMASASPKKATCTNGTAQNNASIELYNGLFSDTNSLKYDFVRNNVYNGSKSYSTATLLGQSSTINNLPNPNVPTKYTIRFFTKHGCTFDTTVTISPINCFCNSAQLSVKEFPTDSSFSSGQGALGTKDPNWEVSSILYKGDLDLTPNDLPPPNFPSIVYRNALIVPPCNVSWVEPNTLPIPFNESNWISGTNVQCASDQENFVYRYYRKSFNLPCNCGGTITYPLNQVTINMDAYADNRILAIYINGKNINAPNMPSQNATFVAGNAAKLTFPGPWQAGVNTIELLIKNGIPQFPTASLEGLLVTANKDLPSLYKGKPKAGADFSQCYTIDSVNLVNATNSQKWSVLSSPKGITLNKFNGIAKGLSKAGKYSFLLTDTATNACSDTIIITIFDTPSPAPKDTSVCAQTGEISPISSGNKIRWYFSQTGGTGIDTIPTQDISTAGTYNYWYTQNINNCESPRANSKIIVNGIPSKPSASTPILYKQGDPTAPLLATGTGTLKWYKTSTGGGASLISPIPSSAISGTYTFFVSQTINNCEGPRAAIEVKIIDLTKAGKIGNSQIVCDTNTPQLLKEIVPSSGASVGGISYIWEISNDSISWDSVGNTLNFQPQKITSNKWFRRKETDNVYGLYLINTGFEPPYTPSINNNTFRLLDDALIDGWNTTATDKVIEVWGDNYIGVSAAEGKQFAELNATQNSRLFQYVFLKNGSIINWNFKHRGRTAGSPDVAQLNIYSKDGSSKLIVLDTANTDLSDWKNYTGTWKVSLPDGIYQFSFEAIKTGSGDKTIGNFLDDINIVASQFSNTVKLTYQKTPIPSVVNVVYCQNEVAKPLVATGAGTFNWYKDSIGGIATQTAPIPSTILADTFSYFVSQTIKTCESPRKEIIVQVKQLPSLPTTKDTTLCQQVGNITLSAIGKNLTWYNSLSGGLGTKVSPRFNTNLPDTVSRWVSQTVNACEGPRKEVKVGIKALPALPTTKDTILCQQIGNISLKANGNDLTWYSAKNGGIGSKINPSFDTNLPDTISSWVSQTVNNCEGPRKEVKLEIKALPTLPTTKDTILCKQTGNISLMANGKDLIWYSVQNGGIGSKINPIFNTNLPDTISRWVSQTVNACEGPRKEVKLEIKALPALPTTKDSVLCQQAKNISLNVDGNDLTWYRVQNGGIGSKINPIFNANLPDTISRWVSQTVNACEGPRKEVKLEIKALPALPTSKDTILCQQTGSISLNANGNDLTWYSVQNGGIGSKINPSFDTNLPDTVSSWVSQTVNNCEGPRKEVKLEIKSLPELPTTKDTIFCLESANSSSFFEAKGKDLNWYNSPISGIGSKVALSYRRDIVGKTEVYVTQTINGCESKPKYLFSEVLPIPNISFSNSSVSFFCAKSNVKLKASGANTYTWKLPSSELILGDSINITSFESIHTGNYLVTGVALNKCKAVAEITLKLKNLPSISSKPVTICEKEKIELTASSNGSIIWKTPQNDKFPGNNFSIPISNYSNSGIYKVISESLGCKDSIEVQVNVLNCPPVANDDKYSIFSDERIITDLNYHPINNDTDPNDTLQLKDFTILTSPSNGILTIEKDGNWQYKPNHIFEGIEILEYRICDQGKPVICSTARIIIEVKKRPAFFPDIFSPNGDGANDFYIIYFTDETIKASLYVYNRWGDLVYSSNDYKNNWSGTCEVGGCLGNELPVGTYFVVSELSNGQKISTYVTLSR